MESPPRKWKPEPLDKPILPSSVMSRKDILDIQKDGVEQLAHQLESRMNNLLAGYSQLNEMAQAVPESLDAFAHELSGCARQFVNDNIELGLSDKTSFPTSETLNLESAHRTIREAHGAHINLSRELALPESSSSFITIIPQTKNSKLPATTSHTKLMNRRIENRSRKVAELPESTEDGFIPIPCFKLHERINQYDPTSHITTTTSTNIPQNPPKIRHSAKSAAAAEASRKDRGGGGGGEHVASWMEPTKAALLRNKGKKVHVAFGGVYHDEEEVKDGTQKKAKVRKKIKRQKKPPNHDINKENKKEPIKIAPTLPSPVEQFRDHSVQSSHFVPSPSMPQSPPPPSPPPSGPSERCVYRIVSVRKQESSFPLPSQPCDEQQPSYHSSRPEHSFKLLDVSLPAGQQATRNESEVQEGSTFGDDDDELDENEDNEKNDDNIEDKVESIRDHTIEVEGQVEESEDQLSHEVDVCDEVDKGYMQEASHLSPVEEEESSQILSRDTSPSVLFNNSLFISSPEEEKAVPVMQPPMENEGLVERATRSPVMQFNNSEVTDSEVFIYDVGGDFVHESDDDDSRIQLPARDYEDTPGLIQLEGMGNTIPSNTIEEHHDTKMLLSLKQPNPPIRGEGCEGIAGCAGVSAEEDMVYKEGDDGVVKEDDGCLSKDEMDTLMLVLLANMAQELEQKKAFPMQRNHEKLPQRRYLSQEIHQTKPTVQIKATVNEEEEDEEEEGVSELAQLVRCLVSEQRENLSIQRQFFEKLQLGSQATHNESTESPRMAAVEDVETLGNRNNEDEEGGTVGELRLSQLQSVDFGSEDGGSVLKSLNTLDSDFKDQPEEAFVDPIPYTPKVEVQVAKALEEEEEEETQGEDNELNVEENEGHDFNSNWGALLHAGPNWKPNSGDDT